MQYPQAIVKGPISDFEAKWPNFVQKQLDAKVVAKKASCFTEHEIGTDLNEESKNHQYEVRPVTHAYSIS